MTEKSVRFTTEEIRAILDNRKTMFRQTVAPHIVDRFVLDANGKLLGSYRVSLGDVYPTVDDAPYEVGDLLWCRETWCQLDMDYRAVTGKFSFDDFKGCPIVYKADGERKDFKYWRPSTNMPREAARIFLRITDVRPERLWDITESDAYKEGVYTSQLIDNPKKSSKWCRHSVMVADLRGEKRPVAATYTGAYAMHWDSRYAKRGHPFSQNDWVWVYEFERVMNYVNAATT